MNTNMIQARTSAGLYLIHSSTEISPSTSRETFAEVVSSQDSDFCGLGNILTGLLVDGCINPEVMTTACRCITIIAVHSTTQAENMINEGILQALVSFLSEIEFIDLAEASVDSLANFSKHFPRQCLLAGSLAAMLSHIDFFPRATQLSALKAATHLSLAAKADDYERYILPVLPELESLLKSSEDDTAKLLETLKVYQNIANSPEIFRVLAASNDLTSVFHGLCRELRILPIWLVSFELYAKLIYSSPTVDITELMDLCFAQLDAQINTKSHFYEQTEQVIIGIFKILLTVLFEDDSMLERISIETTKKTNEIELVLSPRSQIAFTLTPGKKIKLSEEHISRLFETLDEICLNLPCSKETKTLSLIVMLGTFLLCKGDPDKHGPALSNVIENLCSAIASRNSSVCIVALLSLAVLHKEMPIVTTMIPEYIKDPAEWKVDNLSPKYKEAIVGALNDFKKMAVDASISELAECLERAIFESNAQKSSDGAQNWQGFVENVHELLCTGDSDQVKELNGVLKKIQRYISRHDHEFSMLILESPKTSGHPLDLLDFVARPVKVALTADVAGDSVVLNKYVNVDSVASPADLFSASHSRARSANEDSSDISIDMATARPPKMHPNWKEHKCTVKYNEKTFQNVSPEDCLLSYALRGQDMVENVSSLFNPLFRNIIEVKIEQGRPEKMEIEPKSPKSEDLKACFDALNSVYQELGPFEDLVNVRMTRKLERQLRQVLLVTAEYIPPTWHSLIRSFPFLFSFDSKVEYLVATCFGVTRYLAKINSTYAAEAGLDPSDSRVRLGRIERTKVTVDRDDFYNQAVNALRWFASDKRRVLEFQFCDDVGVGLGPTLEFYSMISKALQSTELSMWKSETSSGQTQWITGLYPSPVHQKEHFSLLGLLVARAILDNRILDLPLNEVFVEHLLGRYPSPSLRSLKRVDPQLANTLKKLRELPEDVLSDLTFVHPAYPTMEICPSGASKSVSAANLEEYLDCLLKFILETNLREAGAAFSEAFNSILPLENFQILNTEEFLRLINGDRKQDWDSQVILQNIKADHGYTKKSPQIQWLAKVFSEMNSDSKGRLVRFLTGGPQLPSGGWANLKPALTVVCRTGDNPDQSLPTVMTCANYLKLPRYSTEELLKSKLKMAIEEGRDSFLLS